MKNIEAIIRPENLREVIEGLRAIEVTAFTVTQAQGRGQQKLRQTYILGAGRTSSSWFSCSKISFRCDRAIKLNVFIFSGRLKTMVAVCLSLSFSTRM